MPNRIIKESINESRSLSECSFFADDLYKRLITYADDYGRFNADYQIIRARLYPREIEIVSDQDIEDALIELTGAGKVAFYTSNARHEIYGCFPNWKEHQRIRESKTKCPDPEDTQVNDWYYRRFIPADLKRQIIERDEFKCALCGKYVSIIKDSKKLIKMATGMFHIDHIVPVSQGGRATMENLRLTCPSCNLKRKKMYSTDEIIKMTLPECKVAASCGELPPESNPIQSESNPNPESKSKTRVVDFYEQNIGVLSRTISDDMDYYLSNGFESELIIECIKKSVDNNKRTWSYAKGILKNLSNQGIKTLKGCKEKDGLRKNSSRHVSENGEDVKFKIPNQF